ncbi:hypothetical protein Rsub_05296 [Raphidocelis subcapitata]|uniref:DUF642 domain-containing protein n=1 Tax=Raphidocelis subcapitata TaxID=307507 RepID=A0A2V0NX50_9CHLO|nr:hypothetical protein Rsub_05296 [Raphidocelis subcapitata]|eukprot:GBF92214.1 hypothetical protein Rsub_05296 [Raphidocelis subcapitata]
MALLRGAVLAALVCAASFATARAATVDLAKECPGNLIKNGGFEEPNILDVEKYPKAPYNTYNSKWGWYISIPGWSWNCLRTDWPQRVLEMQRGAVATAPEGMQNLELLPNATGVACQTVDVQPGAKYKLSFMYGRLETYAWRDQYAGQFTKFETMMDALARDGATPAPAEVNFSSGGAYPQTGKSGDRQGFEVLVTADTRKHASQWQKYEASVTGPASGKLQLAFTTTSRPKECGSCGSLLDAICLQKA